jgi:hypothetical protein
VRAAIGRVPLNWLAVAIGLTASFSTGQLSGQALQNGGGTGGGGAFVGTEIRTITFELLQNIKRLRQIAVPFGVIVPAGRLQVDLGGAFVSTELGRTDEAHHWVTHLTDTQIRGAYVFGSDAVVATVALNLPTGPSKASPRDYAVVGAVSPSFLGFPVASYASGFSVTGGMAAAVPAGKWSLGIAGSLRLSSRFTPYQDSLGPLTYKSGVEGRIRAGADGIVGSSRVSTGFTYSTFGDDQFGFRGALRSEYRPGPRWLAEASLIAPVGSSNLNLSLWNFHRSAGDTTGTRGGAANRENLTAGEFYFDIPLGSAVSFQPGISGRASKPQEGRARMLGAGVGLRLRLSDRVSLSPTARYDTGWLEDQAGARTDLHGWYASAYIQITH